MRFNLRARLAAEFLGSAFLVAAVIGCGVIGRTSGSGERRYWFTASTSFANPAVTIARSLSDTFAGIRPADVPMFILAQIVGALCATFGFRWLVPNWSANADQVVVPHSAALDSARRH
jgi:glycerol uptake facilitator-like aquaporin